MNNFNNPILVKHAAGYALILGITIILFTSIDFLFGNNILSNILSYILSLEILVYSFLQYRKIQGGFISYREIIRLGLNMGMFAAILVAAFIYIISILNPELWFGQLDKQFALMVEAGNIQASQVDQIKEMFRNPFYLISIYIFIGWLGGLLVALIAGFFIKKKKEI